MNPKNKDLCQKLHNEWFKLRDELERKTSVDLSYRVAMEKTRYKQSLGKYVYVQHMYNYNKCILFM